jgi:hypothetical protein
MGHIYPKSAWRSRVRVWNLESGIARQAILATEKCSPRALILDVRNNGRGSSDIGYRILGSSSANHPKPVPVVDSGHHIVPSKKLSQ